MISENPDVAERVTALEVRVVTGSGGGPEKTILNTPRFLRSRGYDTICAYMHPPNDPGFEVLERRAKLWDAPLVGIPDRGLRDLAVLRHIARLCRKHRVKIWHGHDYKSNLLGLMLQPFHRMQLVTTVHGWVNHEGKMPLYSKIDRWCLPWYQRVICVSDDLFAECSRLRIKPDRLTLLENAIDETQFCRSSTDLAAKQKLGFSEGRLLIGAVGRLAEEKGFRFLLEAFARLIADGRAVTLAIAGEGTLRKSLEGQIRDLGIHEHVHLLGYHENTVEFFHAMDIFCLSSIREGLPNVLLEALACEVPSVATELDGVMQAVNRPGEQALIVSPGDASQLYEALKQLTVSKTKREQLATAGRQRILDRFSFQNRMDRIAEIYESL